MIVFQNEIFSLSSSHIWKTFFKSHCFLLSVSTFRLWGTLVYIAVKHGVDHNLRFKATIIINDLSFTTENLCKSSKKVKKEVARIAFERFNLSLPKPSSSSSNVHSPCGEFLCYRKRLTSIFIFIFIFLKK